jgi:hypothetical protein
MANKETGMDDQIIALRVVMPSTGDMELLAQDGGAIDLKPYYYGGEAAGPHIQLVYGHREKDGKFICDGVKARFRLKLRSDGRIELKKGDDNAAEDPN